MAYYVTNCIAGMMEDEDRFETLEEARAERAKMDAIAIERGHNPGFWIILDEDGKEVPWE